MIVIVEDRREIGDAIASGIARQGVSTIAFSGDAFLDWLATADGDEIGAVEAVLLGATPQRCSLIGRVRQRCGAATIAVNEVRSLEDTVNLLSCGFDDVVSKPVHARELLARISAIGRRSAPACIDGDAAMIQVFTDGRDPLVAGQMLDLPRRERRILECLMRARRSWVGKVQLFNFVYGVLDDAFDHSVVESHVCRLRKRLKSRLGFDPIESQRFLGYRLEAEPRNGPIASQMPSLAGEPVNRGEITR